MIEPNARRGENESAAAYDPNDNVYMSLTRRPVCVASNQSETRETEGVGGWNHQTVDVLIITDISDESAHKAFKKKNKKNRR